MKNKKPTATASVGTYASYAVDDFLLDDFFILSVRKPSYDSTQFWDKFTSSEPGNLEEYLRAKNYIETLSIQTDRLSEEEVSVMWKNIEIANRQSKKLHHKQQRRRFTLIAACVAIVIASGFMLINKKEDSSLMNFVKQTATASQENFTQLILSDTETINLTEQESEISYKDDIVEVNKQKETTIEQPVNRESFNQVIVPKGKRATLSLSDGTKIWINSGSKVIYPASFSNKKREIYVDGEIFTEVKRDDQRPFIIKTSAINIEVLGTTLNVSAYHFDPTQSVVLVSGSVKVTSDKEKVILKPHEKYEKNLETAFVEKVDVNTYISWTKGMYLYESERLDIILRKLSRYYGIEIDCTKGAAPLRFSGKLDLKDELGLILSGIQKTAPIDIEENDGKYIVLLKNELPMR